MKKVNQNYKVEIISIPAGDTKTIKATQAKINTWITKEKLVKYELHTAGDFIVFNICKHK